MKRFRSKKVSPSEAYWKIPRSFNGEERSGGFRANVPALPRGNLPALFKTWDEAHAVAVRIPTEFLPCIKKDDWSQSNGREAWTIDVRDQHVNLGSVVAGTSGYYVHFWAGMGGLQCLCGQHVRVPDDQLVADFEEV